MWKQLNFCGSGSTLKKEAGSGSIFPKTWGRDVKVVKFLRKHFVEAGSGSKNISLLPHPWYEYNFSHTCTAPLVKNSWFRYKIRNECSLWVAA